MGLDYDQPGQIHQIIFAAPPPQIDWRKILKVYIGAVLQTESITFMRDVPKSALTDDEHAALLALDAEVKRETPY